MSTAVERAGQDDCAATARTHMELLPFGLFPSLGPTFMRRWHRTFVDSPHAIVLVVRRQDDDRGIAGFLLGTTDQASYVRDIVGDRRALVGLAASGALALLGKPPLAIHFFRTRVWAYAQALLRATRGRRAAPTLPPRRVAVLTAITIEPELRGFGIGAELVKQFLSAADRAGADTAELVTDVRKPEAGAFYAQLGWVQTADYLTRDSRPVRGYRHAVGGGAPPGTEAQ